MPFKYDLLTDSLREWRDALLPPDLCLQPSRCLHCCPDLAKWPGIACSFPCACPLSEPSCLPVQVCQLASQGFGMGSAAFWGAQPNANLRIPSRDWAFISLTEQKQAFSITKQRSKPVAVFCLALRVFKYWEISHKTMDFRPFLENGKRWQQLWGYWVTAVPFSGGHSLVSYHNLKSYLGSALGSWATCLASAGIWVNETPS